MDTATGVAPTAGIFISAPCGGNGLPLASVAVEGNIVACTLPIAALDFDDTTADGVVDVASVAAAAFAGDDNDDDDADDNDGDMVVLLGRRP